MHTPASTTLRPSAARAAADSATFATRLIAWQRQHGRHNLPWQQGGDAYRVWLSEIMLQQTQAATVVGYFQRFLTRFPDLETLAAAPLDAVLQQWAGLGYYARARNLHRAAQQVMREFAGILPSDPERLQALPGIGRSTAAAIAALAFGRRAAILDANVKRLLCRFFAIAGQGSAVDQRLWSLAESLLPQQEIAVYTQALMDFGALLCTPRQPQCQQGVCCPLMAQCAAYQQGRTAELPTAKARRQIPLRRIDCVLIQDGTRVLLQRRPPLGIWGGLLAPPEGSREEVSSRLGLSLQAIDTLPVVHHSFTHFRLQLRPLLCRPLAASPRIAESGDCEWLLLSDLATAALPTPIRKLLLGLTPPPA